MLRVSQHDHGKWRLHNLPGSPQVFGAKSKATKDVVSKVVIGYASRDTGRGDGD